MKRALALAALLLLAAAPAARAGSEEFSTFDVIAQEEDDESLLDHVLLRTPLAWRDEWERAPQAVRTGQGCLTSGQWAIDTDLKLRAPLGRRAQFGLDLTQSESDAASFDYLDFSVWFPTRLGTAGAMFRPLQDKSRQDFALTWGLGADTTVWQVQAVFTFEDVFNNLWAFRQTRVGGLSEPYERHPYEPGLRLVARQPRWRLEVGARYLTPSRRRTTGPVAPASPRSQTLWGTIGAASFEARALGLEWEARTTNKQAATGDRPADLSAPDQRDFRRQWTAEFAVRRQWTPRLGTEARWLYQGRDQVLGGPLESGRFAGIDRLEQLSLRYRLSPRLHASVGALHDRIGIAQTAPGFTYGTRRESRAYLGLEAWFGRVRVMGVEGFELDPEPYEVWLVHDKGFLQLQATF